MITYITKIITRLVSPDRATDYMSIRKEMDMLGACLSLVRAYNRAGVSAGGVQAEWIIPKKFVQKRIVLYLHGGGYAAGSLKSHRELVYQIARRSLSRALSADYRLAPEHPHPAALEDAVSAYTWLINNEANPSQVAIMGDSAGGGLTLALLQTLRDRKIPLPACAVCLSPWTDLTCSGETMEEKRRVDPMLTPEMLHDFALHYAKGMDLKSPAISPLFGNLSGLPPVLVQVGTDEILLDDSRRLGYRAKKAGAQIEIEIWPKMFHVWHSFSRIILDARRAIKRIGQFVRQHTDQ